MSKIKVTLIKSPVSCIPKQRQTVKALGLHCIRDSHIHEDNLAIRGMIQKVNHLVKVENA